MRRLFFLTAVVAAFAALGAAPAWAVSGAGYTSVNEAVDGTGHCKNGNPTNNCNIYDGKEFVWLNGGPTGNGLSPDGQYFFAVLVPGGQPNPNDGGAKNLSDDFDTYQNRTFTVTNGEVSAYGGTHDKTLPLIRLMPYADTTNPGGVYIMAICSLGSGYPVEPRSCKYDAFKVKNGVGKVQAELGGTKYLDANKNGKLDSGETGLKDWVISITGTDGTNTTVKTNGQGDWSYTIPAHAPAAGTTTYTVKEVQQAGYLQTGNTVNQSIVAGGASASLASFTYTVVIPNDAVAAADGLNFGNFKDNPPVCPSPTTRIVDGKEVVTVDIQDDTGLAAINVVWNRNLDLVIPAFSVGTTSLVQVVGTEIVAGAGWSLTLEAVDVAGNKTTCDPIRTSLVSDEVQSFSGLIAEESIVTVTNGSPGVSGVDVEVNGTVFHVNGLGSGETRTIDVASAMVAGSSNTITLSARGKAGGSVSVLISN